MDELNSVLKRLIRQHAKAVNPGGKDCLSEEQFTAYLDGSSTPVEKEQAEKHFLQCEHCFEKSVIFARGLEEMEHAQQMDVPQDLKDRTKMLLRKKSHKTMPEVVLEFGKELVRIIRDSAGICTLPETAVLDARASGREKGLNQVVHMNTSFHRMKTAISVEKIHDAGFEIEVLMIDTDSDRPLNDIRVTLISDEKELASFLTEKGTVLFQKLAAGQYVIELYAGKEFIGSVPVTLTSAS